MSNKELLPMSAFRMIEKKTKTRCRCGGALDRGWALTLSDPSHMRTCSVPLCGSCGPVLFDKLAGEGWLTMPLMGETQISAAKELAEKVIAEPCEHCGVTGGAKHENELGLFVCTDSVNCAARVAAVTPRPRPLPADWYSRECPKGCPPGRCNSDDDAP